MQKINGINPITDTTITFGVLRSLFPTKIKGPKPTHKQLRENNSVMLCSSSQGGKIELYDNGYIFYSCEAGDVIMKLSECETYSYAADDEDLYGDGSGRGTYLNKEAVAALPWTVPITLRGELRASENSMNRKGDRRRLDGTVDIGEDDEVEIWEIVKDEKAVDPLERIIADEAYEERVAPLTERQREIADRFADGDSKSEVSDDLRIDKGAITRHCDRIKKKIKKNLMNGQLFRLPTPVSRNLKNQKPREAGSPSTYRQRGLK